MVYITYIRPSSESSEPTFRSTLYGLCIDHTPTLLQHERTRSWTLLLVRHIVARSVIWRADSGEIGAVGWHMIMHCHMPPNTDAVSDRTSVFNCMNGWSAGRRIGTFVIHRFICGWKT